MPAKKKPTVDKRSKLTDENVALLEERFRLGSTNLEAIQGIMSEETYYKHLRENLEFAGRMDAAREHITEIARGVVAKRIQRGDGDMAKWWLERKNKNEFSTKVENDITSGGNAITPVLVKFVGDDVSTDNRDTV